MKSIQNKLSLFVTGLILITAFIITGFALSTFYRSMTSQLTEDVEALSVSYSHAVHNQIQNYKNELELAASLDEITQPDMVQRDAVLAQLADRTGFKYLALADSTGQTTRNSNIADREYFKKAMAGETYMSGPMVNKVDGTVTIMVAAPIDNGTGYKGVLYGGLLYDTFSKAISNIKIGDGGYVFVVDKTGVVSAHPDKAIVEKMTNFIEVAKQDSTYQSVSDAIKRMISGETGTAYTYFNGLKRFCGFTTIEGPEQWSIAVTVPLTQIMEKVYQGIIICLAASLILVAISIALALFFSRSITRPIVAATERIVLLSEGDLSTPVPTVKGRDELALLFEALGSTVTELRSYISDLSIVLSAMADNDFTVNSTVLYKGDFAPIREALAHISSSLNQTLFTINIAAEQVSTGSEQVSSGAQALASGSTEQASSVEELGNSISRIAKQAADNSEHVKTAAEYVEQAAISINTGNVQMKQLAEAMDHIGSASGQIANVTKVIEDIAFQTNILALNAAIEAARAGSAGKGFGVVADEVRSLAAKSSEAAKQTGELIRNSVATVAQGSQITEQTVMILQEVKEKALRATESIKKIEQASADQADAVETIKQGLSQVSAVVQTNAATAEENSATSEEMSAQATTLHEEIAKFKLNYAYTKDSMTEESSYAESIAISTLGKY